MFGISSLHSKGLLTLLLVILTETVTVSEAVSAWKNMNVFEKHNRKQYASQDDCPTGAPTLSIARTRWLASVSRPFTRKTSACDCCARCVATIPRGGHSHYYADGVKLAKKLPYGIPLQYWKVIFQAFLTAINVFFWLVPLRSPKMTENKVALGLANAFSGGVFLSLAFGHLIPECIHGFDSNALGEAFPFLLVLSGYLLIFFVEKVAFDAHGALHEMEHANKREVSKPNGSDRHSKGGQSPTNMHRSDSNSGRSAVILLGALAVHSILEMMALGLADSFGDSALLTLSIALHQPAESIALLVAFLKSGMPKDQILRYLSIFSCMGPIGVALGMAVNEFAAPGVHSIMLALVAGTFIYVGATEVIPEEWEDQEHKWKKFAALMSGIVSILVITHFATSLDMFL